MPNNLKAICSFEIWIAKLQNSRSHQSIENYKKIQRLFTGCNPCVRKRRPADPQCQMRRACLYGIVTSGGGETTTDQKGDFFLVVKNVPFHLVFEHRPNKEQGLQPVR